MLRHVQLHESVDATPRYRKKLWALCCGICSFGVLAVLCQVSKGGLLLLTVSLPPIGRGQPGVENLVDIREAKDDLENMIDSILGKLKNRVSSNPSGPLRIKLGVDRKKVVIAKNLLLQKLDMLLDENHPFDEMHPFHADLLNVMCGRDHYKLARRQVISVKHILNNIASDSIKVMKHATTDYQSRMLKRSALGRLCKTARKLKSAVKFLKEVKQRMGRFPVINPTTQTVILVGFPNVGKSSFMNVIQTRKAVEAKPYHFTTKTFNVRHIDYKCERWQIIDTPGIMGDPMAAGAIEMQTLVALAHLPAAVMFFVDVSEYCGHTISEQVELFRSIKPLLQNKPLAVVLNKKDLRTEDFTPEEKACILSLKDPQLGVRELFVTSCATGEGIRDAKNACMDRFVADRVERLHRR